MFCGQTVFAELTGLLPIYEFHKCVRRYRGNRRVLRDVVGRRWQDLLDGQTHDFVVPLSGVSWLVFQRRRVLAGDHAVHRYVERRALPADEIPGVGVVQDERIARALAYIHDHFGESPGFEQFAAAAHISPFHFHRLFSKTVGANPKQYLQSKRLQSDRWLLSTARKSVGRHCQNDGVCQPRPLHQHVPPGRGTKPESVPHGDRDEGGGVMSIAECRMPNAECRSEAEICGRRTG